MPTRKPFARLAAVSLFAAFALMTAALTPAFAGGDWNDSGIAWKGYDEGLAEAKSSNKPVCLIFYTDWCPHCANYSKVFHDPAVVDLSKNFVMIHLNKDKETATSAKYAPDGEYIPRTFFLKSDGTLLDITAPRPEYKYFYDEHDPASVMASMKKALTLSGAK
jgi:protein-disulfide reductase (glutathione)